jgi:hypothetical protein
VDRDGVERARLREQAVDAARAAALEVVATEGRRSEQPIQLVARAGSR